jgi:hypothetical protein
MLQDLIIKLSLPIHSVVPSPSNPSLHLHSKLPRVSIQVAPVAQLAAPVSHSLIAAFMRNIMKNDHKIKTHYNFMGTIVPYII